MTTHCPVHDAPGESFGTQHETHDAGRVIAEKKYASCGARQPAVAHTSTVVAQPTSMIGQSPLWQASTCHDAPARTHSMQPRPQAPAIRLRSSVRLAIFSLVGRPHSKSGRRVGPRSRPGSDMLYVLTREPAGRLS